MRVYILALFVLIASLFTVAQADDCIVGCQRNNSECKYRCYENFDACYAHCYTMQDRCKKKCARK